MGIEQVPAYVVPPPHSAAPTTKSTGMAFFTTHTTLGAKAATPLDWQAMAEYACAARGVHLLRLTAAP